MIGRTADGLSSGAAWLLAALACTLAGPASAVPLPAVGARAEASASSPAGDAGTVVDTDPTFASATNAAPQPGDQAEARAQATLGGSLRSDSQTSAASGQAIPSQATAIASYVTQLQTTGTDPGRAIDIDLDLSVTGSLTYLNNNSGANTNDIFSSVSVQLLLHDVDTGGLSVFDGTATLATVANNLPPDLSRSGDWAAAARDGDFTTGSCSAFSCSVDVAATLSFENLLLVGFGDTFAAELVLQTTAYGFAGREVESGSNFFDTGSITVSTDTPGVGFTAVPEPGSAALLGLGLLAFGTRRARRG